MKYLFTLLLAGVVAVASPAYAQDPDPAPAEVTTEVTEEAAADEAAPAADEAAPAVDDAKEPAEGDEAAPDAAEGDEKAAEGDEKADDYATVPETDAEAVETATALLDAIQGKEWPLAAGLLLTLLVYLANRFALKGMVSEKILPFVAGGIGMAGATGVGLATGEPIVDALVAGGLAAVAAVGGWEALAKLVDKPEPEKAPEPAAEAEAEKTDS